MYCPICKYAIMSLVSSTETKGGVSAGKAVAGGFLFGPVGALLGGVSGKKQTYRTYRCSKCGYEITKKA